MATKLNKTLRATIVENAFRARFKSDIEALEQKMAAAAEVDILAEHPIFYKMLKNADYRKYMNVHQGVEIRHPTLRKSLRVPTGDNVYCMGFEDWMDVRKCKFNRSKAAMQYFKSPCSHPDSVYYHTASEEHANEWMDLVDAMEEAHGALLQTLNSAATIEDLVKAVPAMELFLPKIERKVTCALMVPEGTAERLAKLGFKK